MCGNKESFRSLAKNFIVIAGGTVDLMPTVEKDIPEQVMQKVRELGQAP
jgi:hypothetical protein